MSAPTAEITRPYSSSAWRYVSIALGLIAIAYARIVAETAAVWLKDANYTHGLLVVPIVAYLIWRQRAQLSAAARADRPAVVGAALVLVGLGVLAASDLFQIPYSGFWSLPVTVGGVILALVGRRTWAVLRFPVLYVLVAAPIPDFVFGPISGLVQRISSSVSAGLMKTVGYTLALHGNLIELPGLTLEVADVCSGFKKMIALSAFALLYGYLQRMEVARRTALVLAAVPIAIASNIARISGLIAVGSAGGDAAVKAAHDTAEFIAIAVACALLIQFGKAIKCPNKSCV